MSLEEDLARAKDAYYDTMVDGITTTSYEAHDDASAHLKAVARRCIDEGKRLDDPYIIHYRSTLERNALLRSMNRYAHINTIGELRALTQDLPDDVPLIHPASNKNQIGYNLRIGLWHYQTPQGDFEEGFALRISPCSQTT